MSERRIFEWLRADHARVLADLDALDARLLEARHAATGTAGAEAMLLPAAVVDRVRELAAHLARQFATHLTAEDEVLYPALAVRLANGAPVVAALHGEHVELRAMLAALTATLALPAAASRDEQIVVQVRDLVDLLRIHIRKEEALVFGVAERIVPPRDLAELEARRASWGAASRDAPPPFEKGTS
jgi:hypothetical protein